MDRDTIRQRMDERSTEELLAIYREHDTTQYVPEAFDVVREILAARGAEVPEPLVAEPPSDRDRARSSGPQSLPSGGFLGFRTMVSGELIKGVYLLGALAITLAGTVAVLRGDIAAGVFVLVAGNVAWRLLCEAGILLFSIHELLASIDSKISQR